MLLSYILQMVLLAATLVFAAWKGGKPERAVAAILVAMLAVDWMYHVLFGRTSHEAVDLGHFLIDAAAFAAMVAVALKADRIWTLWVASSQLLSLMAHGIRALDVQMGPVLYAIFNRAPSWLLILFLLAGTALHRRRAGRAKASSLPS